MARAIWSGYINFGLVSVPVGLYSATQEHEIDFHAASMAEPTNRDPSPGGVMDSVERASQDRWCPYVHRTGPRRRWYCPSGRPALQRHVT